MLQVGISCATALLLSKSYGPAFCRLRKQEMHVEAIASMLVLLFGLLGSDYVTSKPNKYILFHPAVAQQPRS